MDTKEKLSKYWVHGINSLLGKLKLDKINPDTFTNLMVQNTEEIHMDEINLKAYIVEASSLYMSSWHI